MLCDLNSPAAIAVFLLYCHATEPYPDIRPYILRALGHKDHRPQSLGRRSQFHLLIGLEVLSYSLVEQLVVCLQVP